MFDFLWANADAFLGASIVCLAFLGAFLTLGLLWSAVWQWMDDAKEPMRNQCLRLLLKPFGWVHPPKDDTYYKWHKYDLNGKRIDRTDSVEGFILLWFLFFTSIPTQLFIATKQPWIMFTVGTLIGMAFLGRFSIRTSKKFKRHVTNLNAHTPEGLT